MTPSHTLTHSHAHKCIPHNLTHPCLIPIPPKQSTAPSLHCCSLARVVSDCGSDLAGAGQLQGSKLTAASHWTVSLFFGLVDMVSRLGFFRLHAIKLIPLHQHILPWVCTALQQLFCAVLSICSAATATTSHCCRKSLIFTMIGYPKLLKT